ncbi:response regulator transcription factor [Amnibacterium sp.]|uniref:response regulator n=1 Tax=Amnibacterium sp. TaxID=1872496 RepID=UPI0026358268|nr:response regulator transcription factor [Amnibacterium sp.]MCU1472028.1 LuxR family transcriptional regulator [Amnibacterium sp.]
MAPATRVFLVDDHEMVRRGIANFLEAAEGLEVVGEAGTIAEAQSLIDAATPDVVLLDVRLPDGTGIDLCRELRANAPGLPCIILTAFNDDEAILAAVLAGAAGYIRKDVAGSSLIDGIRAVAAGGSLLDAGFARRAADRLRDSRNGDPRLAGLSVRERQVLTLIADGLTNRQIAAELSIAENTVKNYVSNVLAKLDLASRTQAAILQRQPMEH